MKIIESLQTKQIEKENLDKNFQTIIKTITLSSSTNVMAKQLKNYVNYLASKTGADFVVNIVEDDELTGIEVDLKNNTINANKKLFEINSVAGFLSSVNALAGGAQLLKTHKLGNYFSTENQNGFYGDYALHLDDIKAISDFINENIVFDMADKHIFKARMNALKFLDDEESVARQFGANCQFEIFEALDQIGVLQKYFDEDFETLKYNINKKEGVTFKTYLNIVNETQHENDLLIEKIMNTAMLQRKTDIIVHLADLMDTREFYSPKNFDNLRKLAKKNQNQELVEFLDNCKQRVENKNIIAPERVSSVVQDGAENKFVPKPVAKELIKENFIEKETYYDKYGREITVETEITEPYKDMPINVGVKNRKTKVAKPNKDFVLEENETRFENGKKIETGVYVSKRKPPIAGMSDEASDYVRGIWEDKEK